MSGHRRTAVALHGLHEQDRQWMLAELAPQDQATVRAHLKELDELGFSYGPDMIGEVNKPPLDAASPLPPLQRLQLATVQQLLALLQEEPAALIARLFSLHAWPWQEALLNQLPAARRQRIRSLMQPIPATSLDDFLIDALARRLQAQPSLQADGAAPRSKPAPWWKLGLGGKPWSR